MIMENMNFYLDFIHFPLMIRLGSIYKNVIELNITCMLKLANVAISSDMKS